eukprot:ANDGO_06129.mRNA.1 hypothetical protein
MSFTSTSSSASSTGSPDFPSPPHIDQSHDFSHAAAAYTRPRTNSSSTNESSSTDGVFYRGSLNHAEPGMAGGARARGGSGSGSGAGSNRSSARIKSDELLKESFHAHVESFNKCRVDHSKSMASLDLELASLKARLDAFEKRSSSTKDVIGELAKSVSKEKESWQTICDEEDAVRRRFQQRLKVAKSEIDRLLT